MGLGFRVVRDPGTGELWSPCYAHGLSATWGVKMDPQAASIHVLLGSVKGLFKVSKRVGVQ